MTGTTDGPRLLSQNSVMNTTHGQRTVTDRRWTTQQNIDFYLQQAKLARLGLTTRRTEAFFLRQVEYFRAEVLQSEAPQ